jgi:hypothetical protein
MMIDHVSSTRRIEPDDIIPSFITESCYEIFIPILSYIFNSHLLKAKLPSQLLCIHL